MTYRLRDLFCGVGGCSVGYAQAGFDVDGVDLVRRPDYPYQLRIGDAMNDALAGVDAVHASPPCKGFTSLRRFNDDRPALFDPYTDLLTPCLEWFEQLTIPWVIENVEGAPMPRNAVTYCGSSFGLGVRRHRLFASNIDLRAPDCDHYARAVVGVYGKEASTMPGGTKRVIGADAAAALGIEHTTDQAGLSQAIPPAYTEHIGRQLIAELDRRRRRDR